MGATIAQQFFQPKIVDAGGKRRSGRRTYRSSTAHRSRQPHDRASSPSTERRHATHHPNGSSALTAGLATTLSSERVSDGVVRAPRRGQPVAHKVQGTIGQRLSPHAGYEAHPKPETGHRCVLSQALSNVRFGAGLEVVGAVDIAPYGRALPSPGRPLYVAG